MKPALASWWSVQLIQYSTAKFLFVFMHGFSDQLVTWQIGLVDACWQLSVGSCPFGSCPRGSWYRNSYKQVTAKLYFPMLRFDFQSLIFWCLCKIWLFSDFPKIWLYIFFLSGNTDGTLRRVCSSTFICAFCRQTFHCFWTRLPVCAREESTNVCRQLSSTCTWPHSVARRHLDPSKAEWKKACTWNDRLRQFLL